MFNKKILLKTLFLVFPILLNANSFTEYQKEFNKKNNQFILKHQNDYKNYKRVFEESLNEYKKKINKFWPEIEVSTKKKWVQYNKSYQTKKVLDYEKNYIKIDVFAKNEKEAKELIEKSLKDLLNEDVSQAYKKDQVENIITKKLKIKKDIKSKEKIISDFINNKIREEYNNKIRKSSLKTIIFKNKNIYSIKLEMPKERILIKAKKYKNDVQYNSYKMKIEMKVIFAIMEAESSFNPMARSDIPAYGLMQIVPKSAGIDAYNFLYKEKKLLSSSYLYNSQNNIKMGTAYLHILYYKYLKKIKNPKSRLYCVIAAYNTGSGNVARAFISNKNINIAANKINTLSSDEVYDTLIKKLPYDETKKYLSKVNKKIVLYHNLLKNNIL